MEITVTCKSLVYKDLRFRDIRANFRNEALRAPNSPFIMYRVAARTNCPVLVDAAR